jgi:hypothetical protein
MEMKTKEALKRIGYLERGIKYVHALNNIKEGVRWQPKR